MTDIVERMQEAVDSVVWLRNQYARHGEIEDKLAADEIERLRAERDALRVELDVCRDAIETCYLVADGLPSETDSNAAVRRCTMRRLNEAVGKAAPRLLHERGEGQKLYGLRWRELVAERDALRVDAERLDSGQIMLTERDEFGESYLRHISGIDLRAAIDAAMASQTTETAPREGA